MTKEELWQATLTEVELNISKASFMTWFRNTSILEKKDGGVIIGVPNGFSKEWLENKFNKLVLKALRNISPDIKDFSVLVESRKQSAPKAQRAFHRTSSYASLSDVSDQLSFEELAIDKSTNLNPRYTFDNYIVGASNELAHAAASSIANNPGQQYNPFFIYGGVGLGKTHLLHAIGNAIKGKKPTLRIQYVSAETFTNEFISAVHSQTLNTFREKYRPVDVFIVDDIQFIARKERTQEEFFHTFNTLHANGKQIILSSDRLPKSIDFLDDRLKSRFEGGMIADIGYPELEMRILILTTKAKERGLALSEKIVNYIAERIHSNIRELEGALNVISLKTKNSEVTPEKVKKCLEYIVKRPRKSVTLKKLLKSIAEFYDISEKDIVSQNRRREIAHPRQVMMYLLREEMSLSYPLIGRKLGGRDHTTVIHAYTKISEALKDNEQLMEEINLLKQEIYSG